jgi:hypothetical protein
MANSPKPFRWFDSSGEVIRPLVMMHVRYRERRSAPLAEQRVIATSTLASPRLRASSGDELPLD